MADRPQRDPQTDSLATFAEFERELIAERARAGLATAQDGPGQKLLEM